MTGKSTLCVVSPWNYPLFNPENQTHFGGWEVRLALITKELARRGRFKVRMVVADHGQPHCELRDGVTLYSWIGREIWGVPLPEKQPDLPETKVSWWREAMQWLRQPFVKRHDFPPLRSGQVGSYMIETQLLSIYDEVDADIYLVPGNSQFSGEMAFYCQQRGKKYVFLAGSDIDFRPEYKIEPEKFDLYGVLHGLKAYAIDNAHLHLAQNEHQANLLRQGYNRTACIVRNPIELARVFPRAASARTLLWIGKSDERVKRPSMILELARRLPEYPFVVIMNMGIAETHTHCIQEAKKLSNVTLINRVPFHEVEQYFAQAKLHINTSTFEGFPNTFLQAAKYGVPTLAAKVDPGTMLSQHGCGACCADDLEVLVNTIREFMTDAALYAGTSANCVEYVRAYHNKETIIPQYEKALSTLL